MNLKKVNPHITLPCHNQAAVLFTVQLCLDNVGSLELQTSSKDEEWATIIW